MSSPANLVSQAKTLLQDDGRQAIRKGQSGRVRAGTIQAVLAAGLVALTFLTFPRAPEGIGTNGDVSWGAVLSYAHEHRFQFGPQILYTYGPLGFLIQFYFSSHAAGLRLLADVAVCFGVAAGLCLAAWRLGIWWRLLLLGWFVFATTNLKERADVVLETGLFCWSLLGIVESGMRLRVSVYTLALLAAFAGLAKASFLLMGGWCIALVAADLFIRREHRLGLVGPGVFVGGLIIGWIVAGQHLINLPGFMAKTLVVTRAYNEAMGWEGLSAASGTGVVLAPVSLAVVAVIALTSFHAEHLHSRWRRGLLLVWASLFLFAVWKHSSIRDDVWHSPLLPVFAPVMLMALAILPSEAHRLRFWSRAVTVVCGVFSLIVLQWLYFPSPKHSLQTPLRTALRNVAILLRPCRYQMEMSEATEPCRQEADLPRMRRVVGNASTDCFGFKQAYLLFNGWQYRPRPVFQSFFACNEQLMSVNEDFYFSEAAPRFVLFSLAPVDRRFPALEDASVLRALLCNYEPACAEKDFLLLESRGSERPRTTLLGQGVVRPGQKIDLRAYGDQDLWMEIDLRLSCAGRLRQFLYRASTVRLAAYRETGESVLLRRRAPAPMLAAGFLASPLLSSTADVLNLYRGTNIIHPGAYSIELGAGTEFYWQSSIPFRVYRIENKLGRSLSVDWKAQ